MEGWKRNGSEDLKVGVVPIVIPNSITMKYIQSTLQPRAIGPKIGRLGIYDGWKKSQIGPATVVVEVLPIRD